MCTDFQRFWGSVDRSLLLYESEGSAEAVLRISAQDVVCVGVSRPDGTTNTNNNNNGLIHRFVPDIMFLWSGLLRSRVPFLRVSVIWFLCCEFSSSWVAAVQIFVVWVSVFYVLPSFRPCFCDARVSVLRFL